MIDTGNERHFAESIGYLKGRGDEIRLHLLNMADEIDRLHKALFPAWKAQVDLIADEAGLTPMANPPLYELETWIALFKAGATPKAAWDAVPWKKRLG